MNTNNCLDINNENTSIVKTQHVFKKNLKSVINLRLLVLEMLLKFFNYISDQYCNAN